MINSNIISILQQLINQKRKELSILKSDKEKIKEPDVKKKITEYSFKINNFNKALSKIKEYPNEIKSGKDLKEIKGIGKGVISRIDEIIDTGSLKELDENTNKQLSIEHKIILDLETITGIGPAKAKDLFKKNITLEKLLNEINKPIKHIEESNILSELTHHQLLGLKYYEDLKEKIPRNEIEKIEKKLVKYIKEINPKLEIIICGSYRRGKLSSGDIDMLVLLPELKTEEDIKINDINYLNLIVLKLTNKKLLVDNLTEKGETKYMGFCKNSPKSKSRRIDIRFIPYNSKASAMLYFTGSGNFNKEMRTEALKRKYTINEYGIYKLNAKRQKGELVLTKTEKDIFDLVGMDYLEPEDRV